MKVDCYFLDGIFLEGDQKELAEIAQNLQGIADMPIDAIIALLACWGREMSRDQALLKQEGVLYLATWLRKSNLERFLEINLGNRYMLDGLVKMDPGFYLHAQPRGLVCHWIAGNMPTLALFSLVQSLLAKNTNLLRLPKQSLASVLPLLSLLQSVKIEHAGVPYNGKDLLAATSIIHFPSENEEINREFSLAADCRVMWGGKEAIDSISSLPVKEHCESLVFGPKYSFMVIDEAGMNELALVIAKETLLFGQDACTSPHVIFCEHASRGQLKAFAQRLGEAFGQLQKQLPGNSQEVINYRTIYLLDPDKDIVCSKDLAWTILIDDNLRLEEPVKSTTLFLKQINSVRDVIPLITHKVQTVGISISDEQKLLEFSELATHQGAARCVSIGSMHDFEAPWDGMLSISRLVRWTYLHTRL